MYAIEKTEYGIYVTFSGILNLNEVEQYIREKEVFMNDHPGVYSALVDVRRLATPRDEVMDLLSKTLKKSKEKLLRMAIIVTSPVVHGIAKQFGFRSSINNVTRVINTNKNTDWEKVALNWINDGIEPGQNQLMTDIPPKVLTDLLK